MAMSVGDADERRREEQANILGGSRKRIDSASSLSVSAAWALLPEDLRERYEVKGELGRGAFGCVLLAEEKATNEKVAVKIIRPQDGEMPIVMKEGLAWQRINSENVALLKDFGCSASSGLAWFFMEVLEGQTLHDVIVASGPLPVKEACRVGLDVLAALGDIHDAGLIHRDVKPQNIIRVKDTSGEGPWRYKVIDFGSAVASLGPGRLVLPPSGAGSIHSDKALSPHLSTIFASVDRSGLGQIGADDVLSILQALDMPAVHREVQEFVSLYDKDGDGCIDESEFASMFGQLASLPYTALAIDDDQRRHLEEIFVSLDVDKDGFLTMKELKGAFEKLHKQPKEEQLLWLMHKYDRSGDERIDVDEFTLMYGELVSLQDSMNLQGTHGYMPPEQYNSNLMSPASDVWSVGATLFRLVSGQLPFTVSGGTWGKELVGDMSREAPQLKHIVWGMNPLFAELVARALIKDMNQRFSTATQMREELEDIYAKLGGNDLRSA
eukprot:CAMPEP_0173397374 /NCGR_PEP_ID=MMETSP1356-20130122/38202_1 /TAXON_ID=77927 ORGANISM="Hemiselmis virescens, Strain PCC157" /NCGR_SAMPLE_ID=MMETSP1356 /ASSEMBLY_ACC=CAM_ASM_000847 /LENGTH=495 /DNA_ID=CAMNT_0014356621 /DNA_START=20 /DNA_END=1507 /DNA_ORIENTATION=-